MAMQYIDESMKSPEENLACDEALLNMVERGATPETLRVWESEARFVVVGVSQGVGDHVDVDACRRDGVPILRRCSAGGCVVQGPGSLNYALALLYDLHPETQTIRGSYCYILNRLSAAFQSRGFAVRHQGVSDLAWNDRKISGNAQKRRKRGFLHHGTLLYGSPNDWMRRYLREPADRPNYRGQRVHDEFIVRLPLIADELRTVIREAFGLVDAVPTTFDHRTRNEAQSLLLTKYEDPAWHFRRP